MAYVPAVDELYPLQVATIEDLATRAAEKVAAERARLVRSDGSPVYAIQEHQEREAAILADAGAAYDAEAARHLTMADAERGKAEAALATLDGADGWEALTDAERHAATTRQPFLREDVEGGRPEQIVRQARAALAAGDRAAAYVLARYVRRRVEGGDTGRNGELAGALRDLDAVFGDPAERSEKRRELARRIEGSKSLRGRVDMARRRVDGRDERMEAGLRRQFANFF